MNAQRNTHRNTQRSTRRQCGIAAVEFAILLFVLVPIIAGVIEFGRAFWYYDAVLKGTRDAARYLSTATAGELKDGTGPTTAKNIAVQASTAGGVPGFTSANVTVTCAPTACAAVVQPSDVTSVTVTAQSPIGIGSLVPFIGPAAAAGGGFAVTLAPHTSMPYMW